VEEDDEYEKSGKKRIIRADNWSIGQGSWVMGQMGYQSPVYTGPWATGHLGHGSVV